MKLYASAQELLDMELPRSYRAYLLPIVEDGVNVYNQLIGENNIWLNSLILGNIKGRLLSFCVARQFEPDMLSNTFPFTYVAEKVNSFGYRSSNLLKGNVVINIGKACQPNGLPYDSSYRKERCQTNSFPQNSLFMDIDENNSLFVTSGPYYSFLTYKVIGDSLASVNLIVPNQNMSGCYVNVDLMSEFSARPGYSLETPTVEKRVAKIKDELLISIAKDDKRG